MPDSQLQGLRVIDLSQVYAGPYAGKLLADMGAEVIRVESPFRTSRGGLEPQEGAVYPDGQPGERPYNRSAYYNELNRNKLAVSMDLSKDDGKEIFRKLVGISDVVLENFSPRVMDNLGLDYQSLKEVHPGIIMVSISAYGQTGPYRDHVSYGRGIEAMTGFSEMMGYPGGPPMAPGIVYADVAAGLHAAFAVLMALRHRRQTNTGQYIDLSLRESLTALLGEQMLGNQMNQELPVKEGNSDNSLSYQGCYRCRGDDKWVVVAVSSLEDWGKLIGALDNPEWGEDYNFKSIADLEQSRTEIDMMIEEWTIKYYPQEAMNILQKAGVKAGAVLNTAELSENAHLKVRGFLQSVKHPEAGTRVHPGVPWKVNGEVQLIKKPAPCFAQHNEYVFGRLLGMRPGEISGLEKAGVIAGKPLR